MINITPCFSNQIAAHSSLVKRRSSRISGSTLSLVSAVGAVADRPLRGPVCNVHLTALQTTDSASIWINICNIFTIHAFQTSMNLYGIGNFRSKKFNQPSLPVHNIRHFAPLLFWTHLTDWSTDDLGGAGQCRHPVGKARNFTWRHIQRKKIGGITFLQTVVCILASQP